MKKLILLLLIAVTTSSCSIEPCCSCTEKVYEVTEYQGQIIDQQQVGYHQFDGNCSEDNGGYYINNITWDGPYKHYTLTETYCY